MLGPNTNILLVDDEPNMLAVLKQIFSPYECSVSSAGSGKEAINLLQTQPFDLCVLDLLMPDVSGHDVMEYIRHHQLDISIIVISGDTNIDAAINALSHGVFAFIKKPFGPQELLNTICDAEKARQQSDEEKATHAKIRKLLRVYAYMTNESPDLVYVLNEIGNFIYINDQVRHLTGVNRTEIIGKHYSEIVADPDIARACYRFNERRKGKRATKSFQLRLKTKKVSNDNENVVPIELNSKGIYTIRRQAGSTHLQGTLGVARDISERKKREAEVTYLAHHDNLTGLPNRRLLKDRFEIALEQSKRNGTLVVLMFLDLDGFKQINDSLGHRIGDKVLKKFSERLRHGLRKGDTLARFGGDEFILMLPQIENIDYAKVVAEKILDSLNEPFLVEQHKLSLSASIGISVFPYDGDSQEELIENADAAMFAVKKERKNDFRFYTATSLYGNYKKDPLADELKKAIDDNLFVIDYQPLVNIQLGRIMCLEALLRWRHPTKGTLLPKSFLAVAEKYGVIAEIDRWVLKTACDDLKSWDDKGIAPVDVSINISYNFLHLPDAVDYILALLDSRGLSPERLQIEINEKTIVALTQHMLRKLHRLKSYGISVAMDNCVNQGSSIKRLATLPIDTLKIDCSVLSNPENQNESALVCDFINATKQLDLDLVVINVENNLQQSVFEAFDVKQAQGVLYEGPVTVDTIPNLLKNGGRLH